MKQVINSSFTGVGFWPVNGVAILDGGKRVSLTDSAAHAQPDSECCHMLPEGFIDTRGGNLVIQVGPKVIFPVLHRDVCESVRVFIGEWGYGVVVEIFSFRVRICVGRPSGSIRVTNIRIVAVVDAIGHQNGVTGSALYVGAGIVGSRSVAPRAFVVGSRIILTSILQCCTQRGAAANTLVLEPRQKLLSPS